QEAKRVRTRHSDRGLADPGSARPAGRRSRHRRQKQGQLHQGVAGGRGDLRALLRDLLLRHLPAEQENHGRSRRNPARAHDLEGRARRREDKQQVRPKDAGRGGEVHRRSGRLVESAWRRRGGRRVKLKRGRPVMAKAKRKAKTTKATKAKSKKGKRKIVAKSA